MSSQKVELAKVAYAAKQIAMPEAQVRKLMEMLAGMQPEEKEPKPQVKKQYAILVSDPAGKLSGVDLVGWVLQLPEEESVATVEERIRESAYTFNASKRGRLLPVQTVGEAVENIKAGMFRERHLWVKTKTPVLVVRTGNEIPRTPGVLAEDNRGNA